MTDFEFNGVVRLTRAGTAYLIFTLVIAFAAINTGNNALYIGLTFMLGCLLLSGVASKGGLRHLTIDVTGIGEAWAVRPVEGQLSVSNRSWIWNVRDVVITAAELERPVVIPIIHRRKSVEVTVTFLFRRRGVAELKSIDLYTRYPFGFFLKKRRLHVRAEVIVYPQLLASGEVEDQFQPVTGEQYSSHRPGPGSEIHSFRDYVRGDSLRHVYWKKSAMAGRWIIKQTEVEAARAVLVAIDPYRPRGTSDEVFERMISEAATYIHDAVERGSHVVVTLPRVTLHVEEGQRATAVYHALALLEGVHEPLFQTLDRDTVLFAVRRADERASA